MKRRQFKEYNDLLRGRGFEYGDPKGSIFKDDNMIFIHIPKTGGTSVRNLFMDDDKYVVSPVRAFHTSAYSVKLYLGDEFKNYKKFSIIRDPYERVVSSFLYSRRLKRLYVNRPKDEIYKAFDWFVREILPNSLFNVLYIPQSSLLSDIDGKILIDDLFLFGDFKNVEAYLQNIRNNKKTIKKLNTNKAFNDVVKIDRSRMLSNKTTKGIIKELYDKDIKLYNKIKRSNNKA